MRENRPVLIVLLALTLAAGAATAEEAVVVAASGIDLAPKTRLDGELPIELPDGASLTLITKSGRKIQLEGPFSGPPAPAAAAAADPRLLDAVGRLIDSEQRSATPGAFRAGPGSDSPDDWRWIDSTRSGRHCLPADSSAVVWRAKAEEEAALQIRGPGGRSEVWWEEGEATADWPADLAPADGARYALTPEDSPTSRQITIQFLPAGDADLPTRLDQLIAAGCERQAWLLFPAVPEAEPGDS